MADASFAEKDWTDDKRFLVAEDADRNLRGLKLMHYPGVERLGNLSPSGLPLQQIDHF